MSVEVTDATFASKRSLTGLEWSNTHNVQPRSFRCGYCGDKVGSRIGWTAKGKDNSELAWVYLCPRCNEPSYFDPAGRQLPEVAFGDTVQDITEATVEAIYEEARRSSSAGAYTAAVLCSRKLLMHIGVAKGASEGRSFVEYVNYLADNHYVPADSKDWIDHIRLQGNLANHEIKIMTRNDAEELIAFCEMLLKLIYEFPARIKKPGSTTA